MLPRCEARAAMLRCWTAPCCDAGQPHAAMLRSPCCDAATPGTAVLPCCDAALPYSTLSSGPGRAWQEGGLLRVNRGGQTTSPPPTGKTSTMTATVLTALTLYDPELTTRRWDVLRCCWLVWRRPCVRRSAKGNTYTVRGHWMRTGMSANPCMKKMMMRPRRARRALRTAESCKLTLFYRPSPPASP